jgi:hypothetical protein
MAGAAPVLWQMRHPTAREAAMRHDSKPPSVPPALHLHRAAASRRYFINSISQSMCTKWPMIHGASSVPAAGLAGFGQASA